MYSFEEIKNVDLEIANAIEQEVKRQNSHIELIASENWISKACMSAMGSPLTNKYAEGYSGRRYYGGCQCVDIVEDLAIARAKNLFRCEYVNVQPHSGSQANQAAFLAILNPGDKVLGMDLAHGGHLTHGAKANMSGTYYESIFYGVGEDGRINYDEVEELAMAEKPKLIVCGASAYAGTIDFKRFRKIADNCGAYLMADIAHIAGLIVTGLHPSPIPYAHVTTSTTHKTLRGPRGGLILSSEEMNEKFNFNKAIFPGVQGGPLMHTIAAKAVCLLEALQPEFKEYQNQIVKNAAYLCKSLMEKGIDIVGNGTDNHLMLADLSKLGITGKEAETLLDTAHITCNKNTIPNDPNPPHIATGLRIGTPAVTSRGMKESEMEIIAQTIAMMLRGEADKEKAKSVVKDLTNRFPLEGGKMMVSYI